MKMHFLSQVDKLLVPVQAQRCEYVFGIFTWCFCSCCMLACAKKAEKAQFGRSASYTARHKPPSACSCALRLAVWSQWSSCTVTSPSEATEPAQAYPHVTGGYCSEWQVANASTLFGMPVIVAERSKAPKWRLQACGCSQLTCAQWCLLAATRCYTLRLALGWFYRQSYRWSSNRLRIVDVASTVI